MNKTAAKEWLIIAYHDYCSALVLYKANHYTDSIGNDLQQTIEKIFKAVIASDNQKIPKTHDLFELYQSVDKVSLDESQIDMLYMATDYYKEDRYPNPNYSLPERGEIKEVLDFTEKLLARVCKLLEIDLESLK